MGSILNNLNSNYARPTLLKTNRDKLVKVSVIGEVVSPVIGDSIYKITADGKPVILPGVGGITYNIRVGDLACGWMADHSSPESAWRTGS